MKVREPITYPAQLVQPTSDELSWLVDEAAAELLRLSARQNTSGLKEHNA